MWRLQNLAGREILWRKILLTWSQLWK
jgi:hypothetical protein